MFLGPKGTTIHWTLGYVWTGSMLTLVVSSLFIHQIRRWGPFSPIHLLTLFTALGLFDGWRAARRHDVRSHTRSMIALWIGALGLNIWFTLLPGRVMHDVVFGFL